MCGVGPKHVRFLCEGGFEGLYGYTPNEVGKLSLDQIMMLLADKKILRGSGKKRIVKMDGDVGVRVDPDGKMAGLDRDGNPIRATIGGTTGESFAGRLAREAKERREIEATETPRQKRARLRAERRKK